MGKLADLWKKSKDVSEKAWKSVQKAGKVKEDFPKFKSDFQKSLDTFESAYELLGKLRAKLEEQEKLVKTSGESCQKVIKEYEKTITSIEVEGPKSRDECHGYMLHALEKIEKSISDKLSDI